MNPIDRILSFVAPESCIGCAREGRIVCLECGDRIDTLSSICYACGKATRANKPCVGCIKKIGPAHVWIYTSYKNVAKDIVKAYKFDEKRSAAIPIAELLDSALPFFAKNPLVSFVPTATSHRRQRGFDHAELLARELCKLRGWHYMRLLHRTSQARQLGSGRKQRKNQLNGAFVESNSRAIKNSHILLIDDVITTGATIEECTKVLYKAGAIQVDVVAFARTP